MKNPWGYEGMVNMPVMRPILIETKSKPRWKQFKMWLFSIRQWTLAKDWTYVLADGAKILIPAGFEFDGASIPKPLWGIMSPTGLLLIPAIIHDYAYRYDKLLQLNSNGAVSNFKSGAGKEYWDRLFLRVADEVNGIGALNATAWAAVAIGGNSAWRKHRRAD